jgi:hypothetical protein
MLRSFDAPSLEAAQLFFANQTVVSFIKTSTVRKIPSATMP